jgi:bacillithiol biosynthesis cysteine-adding enzyme BshC
MPQSFNSFYVGSGMRANAFLPFGFGDAADRQRRVALAARRQLPVEFRMIVQAQNEGLEPSALRDAHLRALSEPGTVVVATGQQVGLFLGPLYSLYKAASAIVIARRLQAETGARCVPLFWLQTEDHDFTEMASCFVPGEDGAPLRLQLQERPEDERRSLADRTLGPEVVGLLDTLETLLGKLPSGGEVMALLRAHYRPGVAPGRAFAQVLSAILPELVFFDPRCRPVAERVSLVHRRAISAASLIESGLQARGEALRVAGFDEQIELRPGSPLSFFHRGSSTGPRYRMIRSGDGFLLSGCDERVSEEALLGALGSDPLCFSTSALLRPIIQDTLFPTAVYVGGPAEVKYFAQLGPLYDLFDLPVPLVAERAHFRLLAPRTRALLKDLGLSSADGERPREDLVHRLAKPAGVTPSLAWVAELEDRLNTLPSDKPHLAKATARTRASVRHALEKLSRKFERDAVERDTLLSERLTRLGHSLRPDGHLQERHYAFPTFAARVGIAAFREAILNGVDPFSPAMKDIDL